jgi:lipopolysaccharide/colanic/teichoic acid biosynthesis glycosyltransferase
LFSFDIGLTKVILVGNTNMTGELIKSLANTRASGYKVMAVIGGKKWVGDAPVRTFANFNEYLQSVTTDIHGIIQTELYADENRNAEILTYAQENHINYRFVPGNSELFVGNIDVELFRNSVPVINVRQTALFGWGRIVKRLSDIFFGFILLVLSSPLWLIVAILVKVTDPSGPVFYRTTRVTRFGTKIKILKFRSMYWKYSGPTDESFKRLGRLDLLEQYRKNGDFLENDPRVTPVGRFIRLTSLDELPQLWSVFRGHISLVGPRALDVAEIEAYAKKNLILSVKSGLTGLAVVSGRPGISFEERRKLDLYYVQNWSFWLDVVILAKTVRVVLERLLHRSDRYS